MEFISKLYLTLVWCARMLLHNYQFHFTNKLKLLGNERNTSSLVILGNGKSLQDWPNSVPHDSSDFLVVNRHVLSDSYQELKPKYYVFADPFFFFEEKGIQLLTDIREKTTWPMVVLLPSWRKVRQKVKLIFNESQNIRIEYFNCTEYHGYDSIRDFLYEKGLSCPPLTNVLVAAIYCGIKMDYSQISLYGVEHSWINSLSVNKKNEVCLKNPHFFDKKPVPPKTWKELFGEERTLSDVLDMYSSMFKSYKELRRMADRTGISVLNYTKDSFIDAFEKPF